MDLDFANNGRYCMRESLDGDEKISSCKSNLFSAATQPKYFCVCRSVAADAKYKSLMINKRTDYVEALSLSSAASIRGQGRTPATLPYRNRKVQNDALVPADRISFARFRNLFLFRSWFRNLFPFRSSSPLRPLSLSRALCLCLSRARLQWIQDACEQ
jgi:hypothetical protein